MFGSAARNWGEDRYLVAVRDRVVTVGGFAVAPDFASVEQTHEVLAIAFPSLVEYLTDTPAGELVGPSPRRLSSAREQSKSGHSVTLSAKASDLVPPPSPADGSPFTQRRSTDIRVDLDPSA